jgi:hypothetical protein
MRETSIALTPDGLRADLQPRIGAIDLLASDACLQLWRAFLTHLSLPLDGDPSHHCDIESVAFWTRSPSRREPPNSRAVVLERRTGVQEQGWGYAGTLISEVAVVVSTGSRWNAVSATDEYQMESDQPLGSTLDGYGPFVREVEASPAFAAFAQSDPIDATVSVHYA